MPSTHRAGGVVDKLLKKERRKRKADKNLESTGKKTKKKASKSNVKEGKNESKKEVGKSSASKTRRSDDKELRNKSGGKLKLKVKKMHNGHGAGDLVVSENMTYTRVGQGKELFPGMDGRSFIARRLKEHYTGMVSDFGGEDQMSTIERALSKQMASLITIGEDMVVSREHDPDGYDYLEHLACVKTVNQVGRTLGLKRRMRPVKEVTLDDYIEVGDE